MTTKSTQPFSALSRRRFGKLMLGTAAAGLAAPFVLTQHSWAEAADLSAYTSANVDWKQASGATLQVAGATHQWSDAIVPLLPMFTELTGIKVVTDFQSEAEFLTSLPIRLGAGSDVPDVFMFLSYGQGIGAGWLEPLNAHYDNKDLFDAAWYDEDDLLGAARGFPVWSNGERYALPITAESQIMFFNDDAMTAAGASAPKTFEELYETAKKVKTDQIAGIAMRAKASSGATAASLGFLFSHGARMVDDAGKAVFNSADGIRAMDMYGKLLRDAGPLGVGSYDWYEVLNDFSQSAAAIASDSSNFSAIFNDPAKSRVAGKASFASLVQDGSNPVTPYMSCWQACINAKSQQKTAAFLFMMWATSKPTSALTSAAGLATTRTSAWSSDAFKGAFGEQPASAALQSLTTADVGRSKEILFHAQAPMILESFAVATNEIVTANRDAAEAMNEAAERANSAIR